MSWRRARVTLTFGCAVATIATLPLLHGCTGESRPSPVDHDRARAVGLFDVAPDELVIPEHSRPGGAEPPTAIPLSGPWRDDGKTNKGMHKFTMDVPIRPRGLFFHRPQPGIELRRGDAKVPYRRYVKSAEPYWWHNSDELYVLFPEDRAAPAAGEFSLSYARAVEREARLNFAMSGIDDAKDFIRAEINDGWDNRTGLLLPAPARATWNLTLPPAAELYMTPGLVAPELREAAPSDGAIAIVEVTAGDETQEVWRDSLEVGAFERVRVDLSKWSDQSVSLTLRTETGESADYDYVFFGEPSVASRSKNARRVVLAFIDTLRPDHLGLYGYERPTSPKLDAWAEGAAVFENAHSVAPWTLPSTRTVVTGRHPEYYDGAATLQGTLRAQGWATAMFAGNVYLSANFGMTRDWGIHRVGLWPAAQEVTDDTLDWLSHNNDRDAIVLVHYMDPHLPYKEPGGYRHLFAGDGCCGLRDEFHLSDVRAAKIQRPEDRQYIRDRYDNNIRYTTDQLARIIDVLDDDDILVVFADHGEEFWDHKGFEHGHTLYEELLHVPLIIAGPGVAASRVSEPASLLDITPTVLDLLGVEGGPIDGTSLVGAMSGDSAALQALGARDLAFGRPLYGHERWGVLTAEGRKWTTTGGREALYDLHTDPDERKNIVAKDQRKAPGFRERMEGALGRPAPVSYRLENTPYRGGSPKTDLVITMTVPGGVAAAWVGDEPLDRSSAEIEHIDDETVRIVWPKARGYTREVYVTPNLPVAEVTHKLTFVVEDEGVRKEAFVPESVSPVPGKYRVPLFKVGLPHRMVKFTWGLAPQRTADTQELSGRDSETNAMLEAMGYVDPTAPPAKTETRPAE